MFNDKHDIVFDKFLLLEIDIFCPRCLFHAENA